MTGRPSLTQAGRASLEAGCWDAFRGVLAAQLGESVSGQSYVAVCDHTDVEDVGKVVAAHALCDQGTLCGVCVSCRQVAERIHPSVRLIEPDGASLKIEQIREMQSSTTRRNLSGDRMVIVFSEADRLGPQAANALLKTLEEPHSFLTFFLVTSRPALLLSTIASRCHVIRFPTQGLQAASSEVAKKGETLLGVLDQVTLATFESVLGYLRRGRGKWDREEMADVSTWLMHAYRDRWRRGDQDAVRMIPHVEWCQSQLAKNANVGLCVEGLCLRIAKEKLVAV